MSKLLSRLGPGMMLAAIAVGVSHLVFATQAGANYGLSLWWIIVLISAFKYPAFRFATDYACATGQSLVSGYANVSKVALAWLVVGFFADMFLATGLVAMVTAGMVISVFDLPFHANQVAVGLMVLSALVLLNGQYSRAEGIVKILVFAFSIFAVLATLFALPMVGGDGRDVFAELKPSMPLMLFIIAMAGWMPMPTNGAVLISKWVCEKRKTSGDTFDHKLATSDFNVGFGLTVTLALCFLILGTAVLFDTGREMPAQPGGYAAELLRLFTTVIGEWSYPIIAAAGLAVMWSTQIALMDVMPRVVDRLLGIFQGRPQDAPPRYKTFLAVQVVGVAIMLLALIGSFNAFLFFVTSIGFIAAPAVAYYNYKCVTSDDVPEDMRPGPRIVWWNWISIAAMTGFAAAFFYTRIV